MSDLHEEIARLLAGDLPEERARALWRRVAEDPEARAAHDAVIALDAQLASLSDERTPPPELDARVLAAATPADAPPDLQAADAPRGLPRAVVAAASALAALLLGWALSTGEPPEIVLLDGSQHVSGSAVVVAGAYRLAIDGVARVDVEPSHRLARAHEGTTTEEAMRRDLVMAGLAGAMVTVTVYEGRAWLLSDGDADPSAATAIQAGERRVLAPARAEAARSVRAPAPAEPTAPTAPDPADVEALLSAVQAASDPLSGPPPDWPEHDGFRSDAVRETLEDVFPGTDIRLDCSEFPCIGVVETGPDVSDALAADLETHWFPKEAFRQLGERLADMGLEVTPVTVTQKQPDDGGHRFLVSWLSEEQRAEIDHRLWARVNWLVEHGLTEDRGAD